MIRRLLVSGLLAAATLLPSFAHAERLHAKSGGGNCGDQIVDLRQWRPADGPAAEFIAKAVESSDGTLFIALGFDDRGFWSVEGEDGWDACDHDCASLYLVHTTFQGARTTHLLDAPNVGQGRDKDHAATRRRNIKTRLFKLAQPDQGPFKVSDLKHDYKLRKPAVDRDGTIVKFTGWFADVRREDKPALRFGLVDETSMCWCKASWRGYVLAEKKKKM